MYTFFVIILNILHSVITTDLDPLGYIVYCPCMGRFGNQADHFLGALCFAKGLNRTLVLPAWVEYRYGEHKSIQIPFDTYFKVAPLQKYHKVITMEKFMKEVAPYEWPEDRRVSFCYMPRGDGSSCNAKEGNPFGPFWDTYGVDFTSSEFYGPLHYDVYHTDMAKQWKQKYPPDKWPVLAFTGAPASFPIQQKNRILQKYLEWSDDIEEKANKFIKSNMPKGAFIGIHLRNGIDWVRACEHIPSSPNLFAAPQCLGYQNEKGVATKEMCLPTKETVIRQLKRVIKNIRNTANSTHDNMIKSLYVASDSNHMIEDLTEGLKKMKIQVIRNVNAAPQVDLAILGKSNIFIGNCISSFSAFVKRERDVKSFPSLFWAFPKEKSGHLGGTHDEL
ncbi:unnamed protein product [Callosobruchus maculatus]|uniref:GDP-fucose protein O-fucosyltransferase 1 n=1 Tax=Callosobruchus maculatus TaxID=64391 RepID=A0A653DML8_CALMS|nr:unnamed protein product [Callosobruchus maculatus]